MVGMRAGKLYRVAIEIPERARNKRLALVEAINEAIRTSGHKLRAGIYEITLRRKPDSDGEGTH